MDKRHGMRKICRKGGMTMATPTTDSGGEAVSIGRVLSRSFAVVASNLVVVLGIAFLFGAVPGAIINYFSQQVRLGLANQPDGFRDGIFLGLASAIIGLVLAMIVQGALVRATVAHAEGRRAGFGESVAAGMRVALPLIGLAIVVGLCVGVGLILLLIPGIILYVIWAVASPALVEENVGVFGALGRSSRLTKGARWKVFGLELVVLIAVWIASALFGYFMIVAGGGMQALAQSGRAGLPIGLMIGNVVLSTLLTTFWSTAQTSLYVELRDWKDGPQAARLGEVFA